MRKLHEELLKQRNQQFAHTDHVFREPNVERWGTKENAWFALSFRRDNFEMLEQQLPEISLLVDAVTTSLHAQISEIEKTLFSEAASEK
ncbi:MAG TPA: hypothetical protein VH083_11420 [Myxococcales bacterium]|nr:hypothetical protein [Myxococcales bacterium]